MEDGKREVEQLKRYKQAMADIRYVLKTYRKVHPDDAWETIRRVANDPKLKLKAISTDSME